MSPFARRRVFACGGQSSPHPHCAWRCDSILGGRPPQAPPCFCPPTRPFGQSPLVSGNTKDAPLSRVMPTHLFRNHLASSARKTRRPALRLPTRLFRNHLASSARRTRRIHRWRGGVGRPPSGEGWVGGALFGCGLWQRGAEGRVSLEGGNHRSFSRSSVELLAAPCGVAPSRPHCARKCGRFWGGDPPQTPPCFCPPTRPFGHCPLHRHTEDALSLRAAISCAVLPCEVVPK